MHRAAVVALAAALTFAPKMCATKKVDPVEVEPPSPAPVPITSATTPPIWSPPEPASSVATPSAADDSPPPSAELVKARAAAEAKNFKKVRALLEKRARSAKATPEESQLAFRACVQLKDKACVAAVKAKHPEVVDE